MNEKRLMLAAFLSLVVVWIYSDLFIPKPPLQVAPVQQSGQTSQAPTSITAPVAPSSISGSLPTANPVGAPATGDPSLSEINSQGLITINTDRFTAEITKLGGRLKSFTLNDYKATLGQESGLNLVHIPDSKPLPLALIAQPNAQIVEDDARVLYSLTSPIPTASVTVQGSEERILQLVGKTPSGVAVTKEYRFKNGVYSFDLIATSGAGALTLEWEHYVPAEIALAKYNPESISSFTTTNEIVRHQLLQMNNERTPVSSVRWLSIGDKYFGTAVIAPEESYAGSFAKNGDLYSLQLSSTSGRIISRIYNGPKSLEALDDAGFELRRTIDLGIFSFLAYPLLSGLKILHGLVGNWGLAIILLTLCIKTIFLPLTQTSFRSMKAMQDIAPEVKALKERIKDPTQLNQETLALYKRRGVNPLGGCFPIVIQIPVFLGLYNALLSSIELRHAPFALWIQDLSAIEHLPVFGINIPVMLLLMGVSMFIQQLLTPTPNMDPAQKKVMMFMPVIFTIMFIVVPLPAGLVLYWLVNNCISITQQFFLYRQDMKLSPLMATFAGSAIIFGIGFVLTLL